MKKKLLLIFLSATIITIFIYRLFHIEKVALLVIGDGVASGTTNYDIEGYSFNDYYCDYLQEKNKFASITRTFTKKGISTKDFLTILSANNEFDLKEEKLTILQAIANSNLITIALGTDEIIANSKLLTKEQIIYNISNNMNQILKKIRAVSSKTIVIIGLYENNNYKDAIVETINYNYQVLSNKYDCIYIDTSEIINDSKYFPSNNSHYINYKGHKVISDSIISAINLDKIRY